MSLRRFLLTRPASAGFTIIDLVCSLSIIVLLMGMFLPAVQSVREASRDVSCKNNLRSLAIAALSFESSNQKLPPGNLGFRDVLLGDQSIADAWLNKSWHKYYWQNAQHSSSLALLLPFLDEKQLYDDLPPIFSSQSIYGNEPNLPHRWIGQWTNVKKAMQTPVPNFFCSSDDLREDAGRVLLIGAQPVYFVSRDRTGTEGFLAASIENKGYHSSNYIGCTGAYSGGRIPNKQLAKFKGALGCRIQVRLSDIRDGTSQTILYGEALGSITNGDRDASYAWPFGCLGRGRGGLPWGKLRHPSVPDRLLFGDWQDSHLAGFGSKHPYTVNAVTVGGSVNPVFRDVDLSVWYSLCGANDGRNVSVEGQ